MNFFRRIFCLIWFLTIIFLVINFVYYQTYELISLLILFILTGIIIYLNESHRKSFWGIKKPEKDFDLKPVEEEIKNMGKQQTECYTKVNRLNAELEQYKFEQEKKYRDVVRKVLDLDNKLNKKFKLLGESIIKISKKKK